MVVVNILRYGDEKLGKSFFGVFSDKEIAIKTAREYNNFRGGKYPTIELFEVKLDKEMPFEEKKELIDV